MARPQGWIKESYRHALSARGITTKRQKTYKKNLAGRTAFGSTKAGHNFIPYTLQDGIFSGTTTMAGDAGKKTPETSAKLGKKTADEFFARRFDIDDSVFFKGRKAVITDRSADGNRYALEGKDGKAIRGETDDVGRIGDKDANWWVHEDKLARRDENFARKQTKEEMFLDDMDGQELWTDAFGDRFGERVVVGFKNGFIIHDGERFKPTAEEVKELRRDALISEFGTSDGKLIMEMEGFFAKKQTKKEREQYPVQGDGEHRHDETNPFGRHKHDALWTEVNALKDELKSQKVKQKVIQKKVRVPIGKNIPGGKAANKKPSDFNKKQLAKGIKEEMEHTSSKAIATEIAMDHLVEDAKYYDKLARVGL